MCVDFCLPSFAPRLLDPKAKQPLGVAMAQVRTHNGCNHRAYQQTFLSAPPPCDPKENCPPRVEAASEGRFDATAKPIAHSAAAGTGSKD
ncbi:hypothetical protein PIB30_048285 [Stylosanthes scabra]|uniref:Uncharacterized protein n=1 Tax=Stylosanthes scabra TaxID=79078 RepID=A0ABU6UHP9_9FABA|nr:hypothetical protein [Stylosanthes scabra]